MSRFNGGTIDDQQKSLGYALPNGKLFEAKNIPGSNLYLLIKALATEIWRLENRVNAFVDNYDIRITESLITDWEAAVGIPDDCISTEFTLEERRKHVIAKFLALGCSTEADFIYLANYLGYTVTIKQIGAFSDPPYDVPFYPVSFPHGRFVWIIEGEGVAEFVPPYDVPFDVNVGSTVLQCFFNKLKPANTLLYFVNT